MATNSATEPRAPENLRALDALAKIVLLMDAALYLTANNNERAVQAELLGVIYDIAKTFTEEKWTSSPPSGFASRYAERARLPHTLKIQVIHALGVHDLIAALPRPERRGLRSMLLDHEPGNHLSPGSGERRAGRNRMPPVREPPSQPAGLRG